MGMFDDREEVPTPREQEATRKKRREPLAYALAHFPPAPRRLGIYGFEVCQRCGEIGSYSGFWGAIGSHGGNGIRDRNHLIAPGAFISGRHDHSESSTRRGDRFCEVCRDSVRIDQAEQVSHFVLCRGCSRALRVYAGDPTLQEMLRCFTRLRWRFHGLIEDEPWTMGRHP